MSNTFEFDDNDEILLNSVCIPVSEITMENITATKRLNKLTDEVPHKKQKLEELPSPQPHIDRSEKKTNNSGSTTPNTIRRIFPGPAGILSDENITISSSQMEVCSQNTSLVFQDGPWEEMSKDFRINPSLHLHDNFNIAWIKKEASASKSTIQQVPFPFLASVLLSLEVSEGQKQKLIHVTLKDKTGTIQGNILQNVYEEYASHLTVGSVLVLMQFGVLSCTCNKCDNHHLTITAKNLSCIYSSTNKKVIKEVHPQKVLSDYYQQKKELALTLRKTKALDRQNITGCNSGPFNHSESKLFANRNLRFHSPFKEMSCSRNVNTVLDLKNSGDNYILPTTKTICMDKLNQAPSLNDSNVDKSNNSKKIFTFKAQALPDNSQCIYSNTLNNEISVHRLNGNASSAAESGNTNPPCDNVNIRLGSLSRIANVRCNDSNFMSDDTVENKLGIISNGTEINSGNSNINKPKKLFTFKKVSPSTLPSNSENNVSNTNTIDMDSNLSNTESTSASNSFNIPGSQVSVKVDNLKDKELWKDVLDDVDLDSLFNDIF